MYKRRPECIFVGTIGSFCDETRELIKNLKEQSVPVAYKGYEGCCHAFLTSVLKQSGKECGGVFG